MAQNHIQLFPDDTSGTVGYYSFLSPENLVVFVHGFAGKATETWGDFIYMVKNLPDFRKSDVIFYGYRSLKHSLNGNALHFYHCLKHWVTPRAIGGLEREGATYKHIILVAHSLGALVVREVLLCAHNDHHSWVNQTRMLLFAPAHLGTRHVDLCLKCLPGYLAGIGLVAQFFIPVISDLKENSGPITKILRDTEKLLDKGEGEFTRARLTVHAINDHIVIVGRYAGDPTPLEDVVHNHITVCKPVLSEFETPFHYLQNELH